MAPTDDLGQTAQFLAPRAAACDVTADGNTSRCQLIDTFQCSAIRVTAKMSVQYLSADGSLRNTFVLDEI